MAPVLSKPGVTNLSPSVDRNRSRQIITRLQSLRIAQTFPLLALPAELRLMIYAFCFNFSGLDDWFDKFWQVLSISKKPHKVAPPRVFKRTPEVLLICKQVYSEAREVLKKQRISFHHGLLDITGLSNLMNADIINKISHLTIDAKGHEVLSKGTALIGPSWRGHLDLIVEISSILAKGHRLKTFTLDLTDKSLRAHVHDCWLKPIRCDFRDQLTEALMHLRQIRSVPTVTLIGIPDAMIPNLKARMQSTPLTFLDLPGELRNQIYAHAADLSDISIQLARTMKAWNGDKHTPPPYPARTTPTILLLNKQIHAEAKSILHAKPLHLLMPADRSMHTHTETLNALKLISPLTLARVRDLHISVESWEWVYGLDRLLPHLAKHHTLRHFTFTFRDTLKRTFLRQRKAYPDHTLHLSLSGLAKVRRVGCVRFEGDLPDVYTAPLKMIMESRRVEGETLPVLRAVKLEKEGVEGEGDVFGVVDVDEEG